ncbi:MAG: hypothetical protein EXQ91_08135 [Alphaproteobacteria bacterium]|nr:hypothetical protein [Alphaproteobacteria bacterium]
MFGEPSQPESNSSLVSADVAGALTSILAAAPDDYALDRLAIAGSDPVLLSLFKIGTAGAVAIGAVGLAANAMWRLRTRRTLKEHLNPIIDELHGVH